MTWLLTLWSKTKLWALALAGVLAAIGSAWLYGRHRGKQAQQQADAARDAQVNAQIAQQVAQAQEARNEVDAQVQALPAAPSQQVATADPGTAAGKLRDDGWMRD